MGTDSLPRRNLDLRTLKALAHPLRQRIFYHLAFVGEANSTSVAKAFGHNTGATSYHLRQLAVAGLIEEVPKRDRRRERWWRVVPLDLRPSASANDSNAQERRVAAEWESLQVERDHQLIRRYMSIQNAAGDDDAAMFSSSAIRLTREELERFTEEYVALLKSYWRPVEESPSDAVPIAAIFYAFPWPGESP